MPEVDQHFITWYKDRVWHLYQRQGAFLRPYVNNHPQINGKTATFFRIGPGAATEKSRNGKIPPMGLSHTKVEVQMIDKYAGDYVDALDLTKLNYNNREAIAQAGAWALGRTTDEQIIDAVGATTKAVIGDGTSTLTEGLVLKAQQSLRDDDVPKDGRWIMVVGPREYMALLQMESFRNADYIQSNLPFAEQGAQMPRRWLNMVVMEHTGLKLDGSNKRKNLMWHWPAAAHASNREIIPDFFWNGERAAWWINNMMSMNAKLLQDEGARVILTDPAAPLS